MLHCGFCAYTDVAVLACMQWLPAGVIDFGHHGYGIGFSNVWCYLALSARVA
jgi:hypothetical protein